METKNNAKNQLNKRNFTEKIKRLTNTAVTR